MEKLYQTLNQRKRPEDVAQLVLDHCGDQFSILDRQMLKKASQHSLKKNVFGFSSMSDEFARVIGIGGQMKTTQTIFPQVETVKNGDDSEDVHKYIVQLNEVLKKQYRENSYLRDRLNRKQRRAAGLDLSRRQYNKRFRIIRKLERKERRLKREIRKRKFTFVGKSSLAAFIDFDDFKSDVNTACFISYYTARCHRRSEFTLSGQDRPYDKIAERFFTRCRTSESTNWYAMALVFPEQEVLAQLSAKEQGQLIATWYTLLEDIADLLEEVWNTSSINRETMIVRRVNDSSTWNHAAGAWNRARDHWIALHYAMGTSQVLEHLCFGKVLRLMAGDLVAWHDSSGEGLEEDTKVWANLPLPWEVFSGDVSCTRKEVRRVCEKFGVNSSKKGWVSPRPKKVAVEFKPTPELVHGVEVVHPGLAMMLKKAGYFSGKPSLKERGFSLVKSMKSKE